MTDLEMPPPPPAEETDSAAAKSRPTTHPDDADLCSKPKPEGDDPASAPVDDAPPAQASAEEPAESVEQLIEAGEVPRVVVDALEDARAQAKAADDRVLRMLAETDNTRKRLVKDREQSVRYANEGFVREMLPVVDNLERCLSHCETTVDPVQLKEGVELTLKQLVQTLQGFGVQRVEAEVGTAFDPATHDAVMQDSSAQQPAKTITAVVEAGYTFRERLLRAAKVVVSAGGQEAATGELESDREQRQAASDEGTGDQEVEE